MSTLTTESQSVRIVLIGTAVLFLSLFLLLPLLVVFQQALSQGLALYFSALIDPDAWDAIKLTLLATSIALPLNLVFGVAAAWCIARFDFRGKSLLTTLIDLPFSVSPVVAGLMFVLLFGVNTPQGAWLDAHG